MRTQLPFLLGVAIPVLLVAWLGIHVRQQDQLLAQEAARARIAYAHVRQQFLLVDERLAACQTRATAARTRVVQLERLLSLHDSNVLRSLATTPAPQVIVVSRMKALPQFPD